MSSQIAQQLVIKLIVFCADVDLVIDDLNLESVSFIPDSIRLIAHNDFGEPLPAPACQIASDNEL